MSYAKYANGSLTPARRLSRRHRWRSEEHTSELQSRLHLVCRLLLEKKKKPSVYLSPHTVHIHPAPPPRPTPLPSTTHVTPPSPVPAYGHIPLTSSPPAVSLPLVLFR